MRDIEDFISALLSAVKQEMFGVDEVIRLSLVAFYTAGHVLLEGNPGFGKTELVKTLGRVLQLPFGRIQFTPDLMPADITGTYMPDLNDRTSRKLEFRRGPLFTSLLLADEINRATPKTQSAMLEAMAEQQVTVLGHKWPLEPPFMVLATQNPIDHEGTYNLPEAQADRFMFKIAMPVPDSSTMRLIIGKQAGIMSSAASNHHPPTLINNPLLPQNPADSTEKYRELRRRIEQVTPVPSLEVHILNMFLASNGRFTELLELDRDQLERVKRLVDLMMYGLGPRAAIALMLGAKAWSLMFLPETEHANGPALARVAVPILRHRIKLELDWDERYGQMVKLADGESSSLLEKMLGDFCISTAPKTNQYQRTVESEFQRMIKEKVR